MRRSRARIASIVAAAAFCALPGCGRPDQEAAVASALPGAEFRFAAAELYRAITMESCAPDPALRRSTLLARERDAVRALEARWAAAPAGFHLEAARSDAAHDMALQHACSDDSDPQFARAHVTRARRDVRLALERLEALAPGLVAAPPPASASAPGRAEFRRLARQLILALRPICPSSAGDDDAILAPARAEAARFRSRLEGTDHAVDYDLAAADAHYWFSTTTVDCAEAEPRPPAERTRMVLAYTRREVARLEAMLAA